MRSRSQKSQAASSPAHHAHHGRQRRLKNRTREKRPGNDRSEKGPNPLFAPKYYGKLGLAYAAQLQI